MRLESFESDREFLENHTEILLLEDGSSAAQVIVAPEYQARVMTSTAGSARGSSYGWIQREVIASRKRRRHMNVFGGEDRIWLGPEAGQFGLFFGAGDPFDLEHWQVPDPIDWGGWAVVDWERERASFRKNMTLSNYSGTRFQLRVDRTIELLTTERACLSLGVEPLGLSLVAFQSVNRITNTGKAAWQKVTGLLSLWIVGMFPPAARTTVVIPFRKVASGPTVNDRYFGRVPSERLIVREEAGVLFFAGDGRYRSKIGIPRPRALPVLGSYDASNQVLTVVQYTFPEDATDYVNSLWEIQEEPYAGDVVMSYNDGPPAPGSPDLGSFYEIETSSPAARLGPGETLEHVHRTIHIEGALEEMDFVAGRVLGVEASSIPTVHHNS